MIFFIKTQAQTKGQETIKDQETAKGPESKKDQEPTKEQTLQLHNAKAAEYHEQAAKHHKEAVKHYESGDDKSAAHHSYIAHGHS